MTELIKSICEKYYEYRLFRKDKSTNKSKPFYLTENDFFEKNLPDIKKQSEEMVVHSYVYREDFHFQRLLKDQRWYVTFMNEIIAHGMYRNDLEEWIDITYPKPRVGTVEVAPPPIF